jgi:chloride channel 7
MEIMLKFFGSMVSTFTLNVFLSWIRGSFGDLSNPGLINFGKFTVNKKFFKIS